MVHLIGGQILPNYLALSQCNAEVHLLVASEQTRSVAERLKKSASDYRIAIVIIPAYDVPEAVDLLLQAVEPYDSVIGNITGGTKPMSIAALAAANRKGKLHSVYYLNTETDSFDQLSKPYVKAPLVHGIPDTATFLRLAGYKQQQEGLDTEDPALAERKSLCEAIRANPDALARFMPQLTQSKNGEIDFSAPNGRNAIRYTPGKESAVTIHNQKFALTPDIDPRKFLMGGWLEETLFWTLAPLKRRGVLKDLRLNTTVSWNATGGGQSSPAQEIDVAATDGLRLFLFECKLHKPTQDEFQKLENLTTNLGGLYGRGFLVIRGVKNSMRERVSASRSQAMFNDKAMRRLGTSVLNLPPDSVELDA